MPLKQIALKLPRELLRRLDKHVRRRRIAGLTRAAVIRAAILEYLEKHESEES